MIIKVCDRCGKQYNPPLPFMQAILPSYKIIKFEGFPCNREIDLCKECQDDFDKWMNEFKTSGLLAEIDGDISNGGENKCQ